MNKINQVQFSLPDFSLYYFPKFFVFSFSVANIFDFPDMSNIFQVQVADFANSFWVSQLQVYACQYFLIFSLICLVSLILDPQQYIPWNNICNIGFSNMVSYTTRRE